MSIEAMKQALEALERCEGRSKADEGDRHRAITSLRQAIEQAEKQEPVGWAFLNGDYGHISWGAKRPDDEIHTTPIYVGPQTSDSEIPEGWERKTVIGFDALVEALDYAERKGFMPSYIASAWEGFNYVADDGGQ